MFSDLYATDSHEHSTPVRLEVLLKRIHWFILLRWMFAAGLFIAVPVAKHFFREVEITRFLVPGVILVLFNLAYAIVERKTRSHPLSAHKAYIFSSIQLVCDYLILTLLLYFSGDVSNPFIYTFTFHIILSCLLLPNILAIWLTIGSISLFLMVAILSQFDVIPYFPFPFTDKPFLMQRFDTVDFGIHVGAFIFIVMSILYFATTITKMLSKKEERLRKAHHDLKTLGNIRMKTMMHLAHDLKAPLAAVRSSLRSVIDGYTGPLTEKSVEILQIADRRSENAARMMRDMFDLIKFDEQIKRGELLQEEISFSELVSNIITSFGEKYNGRQVKWLLDIEKDVNICANMRQIDALIMNLLSNALKYSGNPAKVQVVVEVTGTTLIFKVGDNGIGIPLEDRGKIFDEFYRSKEAKRYERDGVGLGTTIIKKIVDFYGGTIDIEGGLDGTGTTFIVRIPEIVGKKPAPYCKLEDRDTSDKRFFTPTEESANVIDKKW